MIAYCSLVTLLQGCSQVVCRHDRPYGSRYVTGEGVTVHRWLPRHVYLFRFSQELVVKALGLMRKLIESEYRSVSAEPLLTWDHLGEFAKVKHVCNICVRVYACTFLLLIWCPQYVAGMQEVLCEVGLVPAVIRLITSCADNAEAEAIVQEGFLLCVALLTGGNLKVQKRFFKELRVAKDGSLLRVLMDRIQRATNSRRTAAKEESRVMCFLVSLLLYHECPCVCHGCRGRLLQSSRRCLPVLLPLRMLP